MTNPEYPIHPAEEEDRRKKSGEAYERVKPELERIKQKLAGEETEQENKSTFSDETIEDARQSDELHPKDDE